MARTKGAKGKKTLAKEMGMTLEQYEKYLQNKKSFSNNLNTLIDSHLNKKEKNKLIKKDFKESLEKELNTITLPDSKEIEKKKKEDELILNLKGPENLELPEINFSELPDLTKIPTLLESLEPPKSQSILPTIPPVRKRKEKEVLTCARCHKSITGYEFRINLNYLTTYPDYHRQTESDKGRVLLCTECKKELNKLIDKWLWDEGKGVPLKYGATKFSEE